MWDATSFLSAKQLPNYDGRNIGIQCGDPTETTHGFLVIDVDPRNGGDSLLREWEREHGKLPTTWTVATGGGGWHYYYRCYERLGSRKFSDRGIEVQGYGSYVLMPTSYHVSGNFYEWDDTGHPDDVALADAPDWLVEMCRKKAIDTTIAENEGKTVSTYEFKNLLDALLEISPDCVYTEWISIGMALHSTGFGRDAFNAWHEWSMRGKKHKDGECARMWQGFKQRGTNGITHDTIYYYANQAMEPFEFTETDEVDSQPVTAIETTVEEKRTFPMPDGFLGELAKFIGANAYRRHDPFAVESACMIISTLAQRSFLVNGAQLNLYSILVAPPASGKNDYLNLTREIVLRTRQESIMAQPASEKGLRMLLTEEASRLWIHDEVLAWLLEATNPKSISKHLLSDVLSLWGRITLMPGSRARKKEDSISDVKEPKLSWLGTGTNGQLKLLMKGDANATGLLSRLNFVISEKDYIDNRRKGKMQAVPTNLIHELKTLWKKPFFDAGEVQMQNLELDAEAQALVRDYEREVDEESSRLMLQELEDSANPTPMLQRNMERILRYAGIRCLSRRGDVVSQDDINWGREWITYTSAPIMELLKREAYGDQWDSRLSRIESQIRDHGECSWGELLRRNRRYKRNELAEMIETLCDTNVISKATTGRGTRYKFNYSKS